MTFPDCRFDKDYNEDFLDLTDKEFVKGYDYCVGQIVNFILNNLEVYRDELEEVGEDTDDEVFSHSPYLFKILEDNAGIVAWVIEDKLERSRNELITSMIDHMDDLTYEQLKAQALEDNKLKECPKQYIDTRRFV